MKVDRLTPIPNVSDLERTQGIEESK